jgi:hypothetical protein
VNVASTFLAEVGGCYGADQTEKQRLMLIGEEAFTFIMFGIPGQDFSEMFQLRCTEDDDGLIFYFSNHGRPMNARKVKDFSVDDMEGTADGLSLRLINGLCKNLTFRNLGREGWDLMIDFPIKNYKRLVNRDDHFDEANPATANDFIARLSDKIDIPGIIDLVYNTYRYSYAKSFAYSEELFSEALDTGKVFSMVVTTGEGKIIGHQAIIFESSRLGEIGMAMVDPQYRKSRAFLLLKRSMTDNVKLKFSDLGLFVKAVTSHKSSQAFLSGFSLCLLEVSVYNHASFVGMNSGHNPRESLIYGFANHTGNSKRMEVYVPAEHREVISAIFAETGLLVSVENNTGKPLADGSVFTTTTNPETQLARLNFSGAGMDLASILRKQTRTLQQDKMITIQALFPTNENQPSDLDSILMGNGYFFCGVKPGPAGDWHLVYTNLLYQKFDFENIHLFSPKAVDLCQYLESLYEQIQ